MQGLLLAEFMDFAEAEFGRDVAERLAVKERWNPVAAYPHHRLVGLAICLSALTGVEGPDLLRRYGTRLFHRLAALYPGFLVGADSALGFIAGFQSGVHDELQKLHPGAEVPQIDCACWGDDRLEVVYRSPRRLGDLAEGLLRGCIEHFDESIEIRRRDIDEDAPGQTVAFTLLRGEAQAAP